MSRGRSVIRSRIAFFALLVAAALLTLFRRGNLDFAVFYRAGERFLSGQDLYQAGDGDFPFKYAPLVASFFAPLAWLPLRWARVLWSLISAASVFSVLRWSARNATAHSAGVHWLALVVLFPIVLFMLALGQCDALLIALMMQSESRPNRPAISGAFWAVAVLFKPPFLIFVPFALIRRQGARVAFLLLGLLGGLMLPALRYGESGNLSQLRQWRAIHQATGPRMICGSENQGLFGIACAAFGEPVTARFWIWSAAATAVLTFGAWVLLRRELKLARRWAILIPLVFYGSVLFSPLAWRSNLLALAPFVYAVGLEAWRLEGWRRGLARASLAVLLLGQLITREVLGTQVYLWLMDLRALGLITLFGVAVGLIAVTSPAPTPPEQSPAAEPTFGR